jgi:hypothetical protein
MRSVPCSPAASVFKHRAEVHRGADGSMEVEQVDLPAGAFCAQRTEQALESKFVRELAPSLGESQARQAFRDGLRLGDGSPLAEFVSQSLAPRELRGTSAIGAASEKSPAV